MSPVKSNQRVYGFKHSDSSGESYYCSVCLLDCLLLGAVFFSFFRSLPVCCVDCFLAVPHFNLLVVLLCGAELQRDKGSFRWKGRKERESKEQGSSWERGEILGTDLCGGFRAPFHPLFCFLLLLLFLFLLLLLWLPQHRAPPVPQSSPASPG